jgi:hypothetical protein
LLAHGQWISPGTPASSTTKTGRHDIAEILLKVALNTKNQSSVQPNSVFVLPSDHTNMLIKQSQSRPAFFFRAYDQIQCNKMMIDFWCLTPLSAIFQLYHGDQF